MLSRIILFLLCIDDDCLVSQWKWNHFVSRSVISIFDCIGCSQIKLVHQHRVTTRNVVNMNSQTFYNSIILSGCLPSAIDKSENVLHSNCVNNLQLNAHQIDPCICFCYSHKMLKSTWSLENFQYFSCTALMGQYVDEKLKNLI